MAPKSTILPGPPVVSCGDARWDAILTGRPIEAGSLAAEAKMVQLRHWSGEYDRVAALLDSGYPAPCSEAEPCLYDTIPL